MHLPDDCGFHSPDVHRIIERLRLRAIDDLLDIRVLEVLGLFDPRRRRKRDD